MALDDYTNIDTTTPTQISRIADVDGQFIIDTENNVGTFGDDKDDVVVKRLYDTSENLLSVKIDKSVPERDPQTGNILVYPERDVRSFGYTTGNYIIEYLFWRYLVGNDTTPGTWVKKISDSRTEVRILPTETAKQPFNVFANKALDSESIHAFLRTMNVQLDVDVILASLRSVFKERLIKHFDHINSDEELSIILDSLISEAAEGIVIAVSGKESLTAPELNVVINTEFKKAILTHFQITTDA